MSFSRSWSRSVTKLRLAFSTRRDPFRPRQGHRRRLGGEVLDEIKLGRKVGSCRHWRWFPRYPLSHSSVPAGPLKGMSRGPKRARVDPWQVKEW